MGMSFTPRVYLSDFETKVKRYLPTDVEFARYQNSVGLQMEEFSLHKFGTPFSKVSAQDWQDWMAGAGVGIDVLTSTKVLNFNANTINDLKHSRAGEIHSFSAHYRLHRHVHENDLVFARKLDDEIFWKTIEKVFKGPVFIYEIEEEPADGVNFAPGLARLTEVGWEQTPKDSDEHELSARLFMDSIREVHGHRDLRYGLREVWFRVTSENFKITRYYECGVNGMPDYVRYQDDGKWTLSAPNAPTDWLNALSGSVIACPVCIGSPKSDKQSKLHIEAFTRRNSPQLRNVDPVTGDEETLEQKKREI